MVKDLPKRPEPDPRKSRIVDPTERVKSVADKVDPKFEAARARADREVELRARSTAKSDEVEPDPAEDEATPDVDDTPKAPFSFNLTARDVEEDK